MVQAATGGAGGGFCRPRRAGTNSPSSVTSASGSFLISDETAYLWLLLAKMPNGPLVDRYVPQAFGQMYRYVRYEVMPTIEGYL
ncbi:MAG: hypothetical protein ACYCXN_04845 [Acidimicrobiales bacterium]